MGSLPLPLVHRPRRGVALVERLRVELEGRWRTTAQVATALPDIERAVIESSLRRLHGHGTVSRHGDRWRW